ncbi:RNA polymerase II subunit A C-terminal domain phosphatase [Acipenser ruthenus]|uniref:RNA polymerase II subunit A C-terminal domain phosphatase n=1 Tax=Acipenser ruthenus TaxID=7906 RepID=A0A444UIS3_ACIRT|nr:RNA polymerase II subunit A C-terminal domain phosphatase [Acipenser ruthenus]
MLRLHSSLGFRSILSPYNCVAMVISTKALTELLIEWDYRGHKRKLEEAGDRDGNSSGESSKESSNEDEEGSSSEADEMAAALEAELNDFI